jgi:outer membrane protein assembly factor BamB
LSTQKKVPYLVLATVIFFAVICEFFHLAPLEAAHLSRQVAQTAGLELAWSTHVAVDFSTSKLRHLTQYVSARSRFHVHEINVGRHKVLISEHDVDSNGIPLGLEGAAKAARRKVTALKEAGWQPEHIEHDIPEITLYATTTQGVVHAIDAQTGRTLWSQTVGKPNYPTYKTAANEKFLAVINGSTLYLLERDTGYVLWNHRLKSVPAGGPGLSDHMVSAIMKSGLVETYLLDDLDKHPWTFVSTGRGTSSPLATPRTFSWTTDRGHLYVGSARESQVYYRLEANAAFRSSPAALENNRLFAAAQNGFVYALDEMSGDMVWRHFAGQGIFQPPVAVHQGIYVVAEGNLIRLDANSGDEQWKVPRIDQVVSINDKRVYAIDYQARLIVLDSTHGHQLAAASFPPLEVKLSNWQTDRLFVGTGTGKLYCLREPRLFLPQLHVKLGDQGELSAAGGKSKDGSPSTDSNRTEQGRERSSDAEVPERSEPFGGSDPPDPFGDEEDGDQNPFGGDDEEAPFGFDNDDDPFG